MGDYNPKTFASPITEMDFWKKLCHAVLFLTGKIGYDALGKIETG